MSTYSPKLTINAGSSNFNFDVSVSYASFNFGSNNKINVVSKEPANNKSWNVTQNYKGQYGKASDAKVVIRSNYGSVQFL
jgi:hypothetical protein